MFNRISIIGCGLIGSSILRAINEKKIANEVNVFDKSKEVLSFIKQENLCKNIFNDITKCIQDSDLIIISAPLSSYKEIILSMKSNLKKNAILTDTGSVKKEVNKIIKNLNLKDIVWVSSHPIAGTEESGPKSGFSKLFENRWCIISTEEESKEDEIKKLKKFWESLGSKVKIMSMEEHDYILSLTSHLPHAIAYNLVRTAIGNDSKFRNDIIQYSAGGLRDFTRIASSNPIMWRDIFIDNSENILKVLNKFSDSLEELKKAISSKNPEGLNKIFSSTKEIRKEIVKAGQDTAKPDFGRKKN
ncbi:MAG: cyclohexadienyl dehydrogenase [Pelagibacterales bacterium MED-G40]|nr:MAG: cyclohexadienyl dehydrogenase [Pelagibacterales bacterium MED-G40]|tara:strand:- start:953 stop:1858 length:906 start_codon:yes stop_codon:yes gene_type:complete